LRKIKSNETVPRLCGLLLLASLAFAGMAQAPGSTPSGARGVIRLKVKLKVGETTKGLSRKRFFLIKGTLEDNKALFQKIGQRPVLTRDCYYRNIGASEAFIRWLKENDCESVYCREVEDKDINGAGAVPEFQHAVAVGEKEFLSRDRAREWLTVNLPDELRSGFYKRQQQDLQALLKQAEDISKVKVMSVMTDRNGTAYFTDVEPGDYVISNIIPTEVSENTELWNCEIKVKAGDLATEKPFMISNRKEKNVKCVSIERPFPACGLKTGSEE
jgi:hypothetical protein